MQQQQQQPARVLPRSRRHTLLPAFASVLALRRPIKLDSEVSL